MTNSGGKWLAYTRKNDELRTVYIYRDSIASKSISGSDIVDSKKTIRLNTGHVDDKIPVAPEVLESESQIQRWYDNTFVAYGWTALKNKNGLRKVLFIQKLTY